MQLTTETYNWPTTSQDTFVSWKSLSLRDFCVLRHIKEQWVYKGLKYCWDIWDCESQIQHIVFVYLKVSTLALLSADNLIDRKHLTWPKPIRENNDQVEAKYWNTKGRNQQLVSSLTSLLHYCAGFNIQTRHVRWVKPTINAKLITCFNLVKNKGAEEECCWLKGIGHDLEMIDIKSWTIGNRRVTEGKDGEMAKVLPPHDVCGTRTLLLRRRRMSKRQLLC